MRTNTHSPTSLVFSLHPGKTFFNLFAAKNIELRTEKFNEMLALLTKTYSSFEDVDFLKWLEIDTNVLLKHHSRPKKAKNPLSGSFSLISSFIESEKTGDLRNILLELESGANIQPCLRQMENFVFDAKAPFPRQGISTI